MSQLFYSRLLSLEKIDKEIRKVAGNLDEKQELWRIVDEIIHHRALECVFDKLPKHKHEKFVKEFKKRPHDENLLEHLSNEIGIDIKMFLKYEFVKLETELLAWLKEK